jgi:cell fate regulator YaaT (PSP1 superfamily)
MIVKFFQWDQPKNVHCSLRDIVKGDRVVVEHEWGTFMTEVLVPDKNIEEEESAGRVARKATNQDINAENQHIERQQELLLEIKNEVKQFDLPMKIVDVKLSLEGGAMVVAFLAEGRVDFRSLVKSLSTKYQKTVRFQQIGSRDEARRIGGYGICGREICCRKFPGSLQSISTEMARCQFISHRGSDRISGSCGRLMCCLAFEAEQYQELFKNLPQRGDKVVVKQTKKRGKVIDLNALRQTVKIALEDGSFVVLKSDEYVRE